MTTFRKYLLKCNSSTEFFTCTDLIKKRYGKKTAKQRASVEHAEMPSDSVACMTKYSLTDPWHGQEHVFGYRGFIGLAKATPRIVTDNRERRTSAVELGLLAASPWR